MHPAIPPNVQTIHNDTKERMKMETTTYETNSQPVNSLRFESTSDPSIFRVVGLSTDRDLVNRIGLAQDREDVPKGHKYVQFDDGIFAVVRKRGGDQGEYTTRAPRSQSSAPPTFSDPMAALRALDQETAAKKARIKAQLDIDIAGLEERLAQLKESRDQLGMKH
jgi:hypothetical protein